MILFGSAASDLSELLSLPMQSALDGNRLRHDDPVSRQFLGALVDGLLPQTGSQARCTVIASVQNPELSPLEDDDLGFLLRLVKLRGYEPQVITPGMSLVLSTCEQSGYSGIALKLGATRIDVSVVHQTRELVQFSLPRGGKDLDRQLALQDESYLRLQNGQEVLDVRPMRVWREQVQSIQQVDSPRSLELRNQYRELLRLPLHRLQQELTLGVIRQLPSQLPLIIGGSLAAPAGTEILLQEILREIQLPLAISTVRTAPDLPFACLKGALIANDVLTDFPEQNSAA